MSTQDQSYLRFQILSFGNRYNFLVKEILDLKSDHYTQPIFFKLVASVKEWWLSYFLERENFLQNHCFPSIGFRFTPTNFAGIFKVGPLIGPVPCPILDVKKKPQQH